MTGSETLNKALKLLGYTDSFGTPEMSGRIKSRSVAVINAVYSDLFYLLCDRGFQPIKELKDEIHLPERVLNDIMPYGVAAFLAQGESDGDQQQYFMTIYNNKRIGVAKKTEIHDVIPSVDSAR